MSTDAQKIEMTDNDVLKYLAVAAKDEAVIIERTRTIDQIKRIYAVVMGFALTTCITNAVLCLRSIKNPAAEEISIVAASVIAFGSILALFYLGAERLLDRKYLQPNSQVPRKLELGFDLLTLSVTAMAFVIIANIFQPPAPDTPHGVAKLRDLQAQFIEYLKYICVLDIGLVALQGMIVVVRYPGRPTQNDEDGQDSWFKLLMAHLAWIAINAGTIVALHLLPKMFGSDQRVPLLETNAIATCLIALFLVRFAIDFGSTFPFYYPPAKLSIHKKAIDT